MKSSVKQKGFTLIELMIVVAILGILASIALNFFRHNVNRSNRAEARGLLLENAGYMERFATENNGAYDQTMQAPPVASVLPVLLSPRNAAAGRQVYTISFAVATTPTAYTIQAVPRVPLNDDCGTLTINNLGQKTASAPANGFTVETCWNK